MKMTNGKLEDRDMKVDEDYETVDQENGGTKNQTPKE